MEKVFQVHVMYRPPSNGGDGGSGGGIFNSGEMDLIQSSIERNKSGQGGYKGTITVNGAKNGAGGSGGGVFNQGTLTAAYLEIQDNTTGLGYSVNEPAGSGGGLANEGSLTFSNSLVRATAPRKVASAAASYSVRSSLVCPQLISKPPAARKYQRQRRRRAVRLWDDVDILLDNLIVADNHVPLDRFGSGLYFADLQASLRHLTLASNDPLYGSGIYAITSTLSLTNTIIAAQHTGVYVAPERQRQHGIHPLGRGRLG